MIEKFKAIIEPVAKLSTRIAAKTHANAPQIKFYSGMVVLACGTIYGLYKAYRGASEVSEKYNSDKEYIDNLYSDKESFKKERFWAKTKSVGGAALIIAKQQAVPFAINVAGGLLIFNGFNDMAARAIVLSGLLAETTKELNNFYGNVSDQYGEEEAQKLRYGLKQEVKEVEETDPKTGEVTKKKTMVLTGDISDLPYSYVLEEGTMDPRYWTDSAFLNKKRLKDVICMANSLLNERGYIFLWEVLSMLGYRGQLSEKEYVVGWIKKGLVPNWHGDGFISDGVIDATLRTERIMAFLSGNEPNVVVNFNVDGAIWNALNKHNLWRA